MQETFELAQQGGWPMVFLGMCSVAAVTIIIERMLALRRSRNIPQSIIDLLEVYQGEESAEPVMQACRHNGSPFARLIESLISSREMTHAQLQDTLNASGRREVVRMERGLLVLEVVAGISPLIGLLGTVLGMVTVFNAISVHGLGDAQVLSDGISKALVTTVAGLSVAIPAFSFHSYFSRRVESMAIEMQDRATHFVVKLNGTGD